MLPVTLSTMADQLPSSWQTITTDKFLFGNCQPMSAVYSMKVPYTANVLLRVVWFMIGGAGHVTSVICYITCLSVIYYYVIIC